MRTHVQDAWRWSRLTALMVALTLSNACGDGEPSADTEPPTAPGNLVALATAPTQVNLGWSASTPAAGVDHYDVLRDANKIAATADLQYTDDSALPATTYTYSVRAVDEAGNASAPSNAAAATTPGQSSGRCPLPAYPDASCTGVIAGTVLEVINGNLTINTSNTVIDSKDIRGCVVVNVPGVVIRNSRITCSGSALFNSEYAGTGLVIEDVEVTCRRQGGTGISAWNYIARRVNVYGCENGFWAEGNVLIEDSYVHDADESGVDPHTDAVQVPALATNITVRHNRLYAFSTVDGKHGTSAIINPRTGDGGASNILITNNLLAGGAYALYCQQDGAGTNFRVIDNRFSTVFSPNVAAFGPWVHCEDETEVRGNVYHETGQPLP